MIHFMKVIRKREIWVFKERARLILRDVKEKHCRGLLLQSALCHCGFVWFQNNLSLHDWLLFYTDKTKAEKKTL